MNKDAKNSQLPLEGSSSESSWKKRILQKLDLLEQRIGNSPVVPIVHPKIHLLAKIETGNLMGSVKDRAAYRIIRDAIENDLIHEDSEIIEASSGNFAVSCSAISAMLQLKFIAVIDPYINRSYEKLIEFFSHKVIKVDQKDKNQGYLLTKLEKVEQICRGNAKVFWLNQYGNPSNYEAHYYGTAAEICRQVKTLDFVFVAVATGGTIAGISCRLKETFPNVKIIAVDAEGSVIFGGPPKPRFIPGMGSGMVPPLVSQAKIDEFIRVKESDTVRACHELFFEHGLFLGGSTGTVYHGIKRYFEDKTFATPPTVLFLCPDRGHGYIDNVYDHEWLSWFSSKTNGPSPTS